MDIAKINDLRMKIHRGEDPTVEELNAAIEWMIADRAAFLTKKVDAANKSAAKSAPKVKVDLSDLAL